MFKLIIKFQTFCFLESHNLNVPVKVLGEQALGDLKVIICVILFQSNAKLKLVRSLAVCEESSGPFSNDGPPESVLPLTPHPNLHP